MGFPFFHRRTTFEVLVQQHQHRVYGFACFYLKDHVLAEDVTQDVFLRLWSHREEIDEARLPGWLIRVTRNACIDILRKQKLERRLMDVNTDDLEMKDSGEPTPEDTTETLDFQEQLQRALDGMTEPYRSIVILREIQEMKYEEISEALDLPLNTTKVYLHRARKMLRHQLNEVIDRETA